MNLQSTGSSPSTSTPPSGNTIMSAVSAVANASPMPMSGSATSSSPSSINPIASSAPTPATAIPASTPASQQQGLKRPNEDASSAQPSKKPTPSLSPYPATIATAATPSPPSNTTTATSISPPSATAASSLTSSTSSASPASKVGTAATHAHVAPSAAPSVNKPYGAGHTAVPTAAAAQPQSVEALPRVQDALGYLEKVKTRFATAPAIYNQFLDIMKDFKSQAIDTEGVIRRVKALFKGNRSLILGFNQFLPPGYKIEVDTPSTAAAAAAPHSHGHTHTHSHTPATATIAGHSHAHGHTHTAAGSGAAAGTVGSGAAVTTPAATGSRPNIEFNHAVQYVAKIKNRFKDQPDIYAEFLDILHDYQAKRTIEEVYQRVQKLFAGQPDLLYEFKYFLPDNAFVAGSSTSTPTAHHHIHGQQHRKASTSAGRGGVPGRVKAGKKAGDGSTPSSGQKQRGVKGMKDRSAAGQARGVPTAVATTPSAQGGLTQQVVIPPNAAAIAARQIPKSTFTTIAGKLKKTVIYPAGSEKELALFDRLKQWCDKRQWMQLLKAFNLYANDIITRPELLHMYSEILGERPGADDFYQKFRAILQYDDSEEKQLNAGTGGYYTYISNADLATSAAVTTSYRALPAALPIPSCSGRTSLGDNTLNDQYISIPTGSEDFSFKASRKNIYEENLFRCEDERYELDMVIENNNSVIQLLTPVAQQLEAMSSEQQRQFDIEPILDILHLRAIARIYGDNATDIIEMLKLHPIQSIPIILQRMKQKDIEWRLIQQEMRLPWRRIFEQNYVRSLDHRSFYFKQEDKKRRLPKVLVQELREVHQQYFVNQSLTQDEKVKQDVTLTDSVTPLLRQVREGSAPSPIFNYCMRFLYPERDTHHEVLRILMYVAKKTYTAKDQYRLYIFLTGFVYQFFGIELSAEQQQQLITLKQAAELESTEPPAPVPVTQHIVNSTASTADKDAMQVDSDDDASVAGGAATAITATSTTLPTMQPQQQRPKKGGKKQKQKQRSMQGTAAAGATDATSVVRAKENVPSISGHGAEVEDDEAGVDDVEVDRATSGKASSDGEGEDGEEEKRAGGILTGGVGAGATQGGADGTGVNRSGVLPTTLSSSSAPSIETIIQKLQKTLSGEWKAETHVKPMRLSIDTWKLEEMHNPIRLHTRPSRLFFASNALYVFFRLHQFLYERLSAARQLSHKSRKQMTKKSKIPATSEERWQRFLELVYELLDGTLESSKFEDECRNLLGASAYVLFNMDKLVAQLVKQSVSLIHNDTSLKLLALYQYELQRIQGMPPVDPNDKEAQLQRSAELCRVYLSNAASILQDDHVCQIEYFQDSMELCVGLVDGLQQHDEPKNVSMEWASWLENYVSIAPNLSSDQRCFLLRNVQQFIRKGIANGSFASAAAADKQAVAQLPKVDAVNRNYLLNNQSGMDNLYDHATNKALIINGMETFIDVRTYKRDYLDSTEDLFIREAAGVQQHRKSDEERQQVGKRKIEEFNKWLTERLAQFKAAEAEAAEETAAEEALDDAAMTLLDAAHQNEDDDNMDAQDDRDSSSASNSPSPSPDEGLNDDMV